MGQITIRIDDELESKIEERRGDKPKSDFYREILTAYLTAPDCKLTTSDDNFTRSLEQQISQLREQIADLRADKSKLMALLNQEQALHLKTQMLLPPAPEQKWWQFWK